jgi:beta-glucosidase
MNNNMTVFQFPQNFKWGTATAAYQIEGAYREDGKGMSIWNTFSHTANKVYDGDNGDVACNSYHRLEEDVELLKDLGVSLYRFSVAWPRIYPYGTGELNRQGLDITISLWTCAFVTYAETMFRELNGKVKHWITFNEPWCVSFLSNYIGMHAQVERCLQLAVDVGHHLLVAHGKAV